MGASCGGDVAQPGRQHLRLKTREARIETFKRPGRETIKGNVEELPSAAPPLFAGYLSFQVPLRKSNFSSTCTKV